MRLLLILLYYSSAHHPLLIFLCSSSSSNIPLLIIHILFLCSSSSLPEVLQELLSATKGLLIARKVGVLLPQQVRALPDFAHWIGLSRYLVSILLFSGIGEDADAPVERTEEEKAAVLEKQLEFRRKIAGEVLSTEETYVFNLQLLIDHYLRPLKVLS